MHRLQPRFYPKGASQTGQVLLTELQAKGVSKADIIKTLDALFNVDRFDFVGFHNLVHGKESLSSAEAMKTAEQKFIEDKKNAPPRIVRGRPSVKEPSSKEKATHDGITAKYKKMFGLGS